MMVVLVGIAVAALAFGCFCMTLIMLGMEKRLTDLEDRFRRSAQLLDLVEDALDDVERPAWRPNPGPGEWQVSPDGGALYFRERDRDPGDPPATLSTGKR